MAIPRSDVKRNAIMSAAIHIIASQGLSAPTASIAKEAGVSKGLIFTYFETKADLLNQLYVELKAEMVDAALGGLPSESNNRTQMLYAWSHWLSWATDCPDKRRVLAHLGVSDDITLKSRQTASDTLAELTKLLDRCRKNGPMRDVPLRFVVAMVDAMADAAIDFIIDDPTNGENHCMVAFEALWRMIT